MNDFLGISKERWIRVVRTLRQAVYGLALSTGIALVGILTDTFKTEFGTQVWWPIGSTVLTAVAAYLMHLRETKKG